MLSDSFQLYLYNDSAIAFDHLKSLEYIAASHKEKGQLYIFKGWYSENYENNISAYENYVKAQKYFVKAQDMQGVANAYGNQANIFDILGQYKQSLDLHQQALMANEKVLLFTKDSVEYKMAMQSKSASLGNMGGIFMQLHDYKSAQQMLLQSLELDSIMNDKYSMGISYQTLGICARNLNELEKASSYFKKALALYLTLNDSKSLLHLYINLGNLYIDLNKLNLAKESFLESRKLIKGASEKKQMTHINNGIARVYSKQGNFNEAEILLNESYSISIALKNNERIYATSKLLAEVYAQKKSFEKAYGYNKIAQQYRDSVYNEENYRALGKAEVSFNFALQTLKDSIAFEQEREINRIENLRKAELIEKQSYIIYLTILGILLIAIVTLLFIRGYINKKKANLIILEQKQIVEDKNKQIIDSINYAKRIQDAILPRLENFKNTFPESFILYKPKDVVSGDFYWMETPLSIIDYEANQKPIFVAAADCTGHGVPGALVSVICSQALSKALLEDKIETPGNILDKAREHVIKHFSKSTSTVMDGMDISLVKIIPNLNLNTNHFTLEWAGANNPLWVIKQNENTVFEIKGDKQSVANFGNQLPFTTHVLQLKKGDQIYLITDGYIDQFGGDNYKKFMSKPLKNLLLSCASLPMEKQMQVLEQNFENWKGTHEQFDDVCIIGIKL